MITLRIRILRHDTDQDVITAEDHAGLLISPIIAEDKYLASQSCLLDSHRCANGATVVAGPDHIDLRMSCQHISYFCDCIVLNVGAHCSNFFILHTSFIQTSEEAAPTCLRLLGDLVIKVHLRNIDIAFDVGFDELRGLCSYDLAV